MSDKIYFSTTKKFNFKKSMINLTTRLHHRIAPKHAEKTARKLFLTPVRFKPINPEPNRLIKDTLTTKEGMLKTYRLGSGPVWILTHGWSGGANQYFPLMQHIADQGFTAFAYDHPAHGESSGTIGHIPAFVEGLKAVLEHFDEVAGLIGHSMGNATAIECQHPKLADKPMLLIAPVLKYFDNLYGSVERSGYSMRLFNSVLSSIEQQYNYPISSVDPYSKLKQRDAQTLIVHDPEDKFANFTESEQAAKEMTNVNLVTTSNQGHGRIMKSDHVMAAFDQLAKA